MIQDLLNRIPEAYGGAGGKLKGMPRWGIVREELYQAILSFQKAHAAEGLLVDGHVDPHEKTLRLLLKVAYDYIFAYPDIEKDLSFPKDDGVVLPPETPKARQFRIRFREGGSVGPIVILRFDFWDFENDLSAEYKFRGLSASAGIPASLTDAGDFTDFNVAERISVNAFAGLASFSSTGGLNTSFSELALLAPPIHIRVQTGFTEGFDFFSIGGGVLSLDDFHKGSPRRAATSLIIEA
jgi:hypothetical protein